MDLPWRLAWLLVLGSHAVAAFAWWWLLPGGFPLWHPRFWSNGVAPVAVVAVVVTAVVAGRRHRTNRLRSALAAFPAFWAAAALAGRVVFPVTLARLFALPLLGAALMGAALYLTFRRKLPSPGRSVWVVAALAASLGAVLPLTQRAPAPDTRPLNLPMPEVAGSTGSTGGRLGPRLFVLPGDGSVSVSAGGLRLLIQPILRFLSESPDGCLTILAPSEWRERPALRLSADSRRAGGVALRYRADYEATLRVGPDSAGSPIALTATARLSRPVYSHLNSFCDIAVSGHRRLALSFSPCPGQRIEVRPADYPVGRPLRLAYLDSRGGFHVVEATSGEKGPFRELAGGRLGRSDPLAITLHDRDAPIARIVLEDWPAQAGTVLSPTAGWGLPVNAIEFSLNGDAPGSTAEVYVTLAGTSVGRGWDSVGHRAGIYRNQMRIETLGNLPVATQE